MFPPDVRVELLELDENLLFWRPVAAFDDTDGAAVLDEPLESPLDGGRLETDLELFVDLERLVFNLLVLAFRLSVDHLVENSI